MTKQPELKHNYSFKFTLKTLSPVSVGTGDKLSPMMDYVIDGEKLAYIHPRKLEKYLEAGLAEDKNFVTKFMNKVKSVTKHNKEKFLADFIEANPTAENYVLEDLFKEKIAQYLEGKNPVELSSTIKNGGSPYIPGSSVKGAFKTAILYGWLTQNDQGKTRLANFARSVQITKDRSQQKFWVKDILKSFNEFDKALFGDMRDKKRETKLDAALLQVRDTDTQPISECLMASAVQRISLKGTEQSVIPSIREVIKPNTHFKLNVVFDTYMPEKFKAKSPFQVDHNYLSFLGKDNFEDLGKVINQFSLAVINYELEVLDKYKHDLDEYVYEDFLNFYQNQLLPLSQTPGVTVFPIGFGKTYYMNSVGLALKKGHPGVFAEIREVFGRKMGIMQRGHTGKGEFPITRSICSFKNQSYLPMGWVAISEQGEIPMPKVEKTGKATAISAEPKEQKNEEPVTKIPYNKAEFEVGNSFKATVLERGIPNFVSLLVEGYPFENKIRMVGLKKNNTTVKIGDTIIVTISSLKEDQVWEVKFLG